MPFSPELIEVLRCPETGQRLRVSQEEDALDPESFSEGALLTESGDIAYPIRNGFPILLKAEAVRLS